MQGPRWSAYQVHEHGARDISTCVHSNVGNSAPGGLLCKLIRLLPRSKWLFSHIILSLDLLHLTISTCQGHTMARRRCMGFLHAQL